MDTAVRAYQRRVANPVEGLKAPLSLHALQIQLGGFLGERDLVAVIALGADADLVGVGSQRRNIQLDCFRVLTGLRYNTDRRKTVHNRVGHSSRVRMMTSGCHANLARSRYDREG